MRFTRAFTAIALLASGLTFVPASSSSPAFASSGLDDRLIISLPEGVRTGSRLSGATNIVDLTLMRSLGDDMGVYVADRTLNDVGLAVLERDLRAVDPGVTVERDEWVTPAAINYTFFSSH